MQKELELSLYPNPVNQNVFIDFNLDNDTDMSFEVLNSMGQIVKYIYEKRYEKGFQNISIDVSGLSSGVYYFKTYSNMKVKVLKFIKL